jgi:hypothetical protein
MPNASLLGEMIDAANVETICTPPSVLEDVADSPEITEKLSKVSYCLTGGGMLDRSVDQTNRTRSNIQQSRRENL